LYAPCNQNHLPIKVPHIVQELSLQPQINAEILNEDDVEINESSAISEEENSNLSDYSDSGMT
jgi:hypothetical protein